MSESPPRDPETGASASQRHLDVVRARLLDRALLIGALLAAPVMAGVVYRAWAAGASAALYIQLAAASLVLGACVFRRRIAFRTQALLLLLLMLAVGTSSTLSYGLLGMGFPWFLVACVFAAIFLGTRAGILAAAAALSLAAVMAAGLRLGAFPCPLDVETFAVSPANWITAILTFILLATLIVLLLGSLHAWLTDSNRLLNQRALELSRVNRDLNRTILEQEQTARALRESEQQYRLLADNVSDTIWVFRLRDLRFLYVSPSVEKVLGYTDREMLDLPLDRILTPAGMKRVQRIVGRELAREREGRAPGGRAAVVLELEQVRKDGARVWTEVTASFLRDENGTADRVLGITRDITERRKVEESLRQSENKFSEAFHANASLMAISSRQDGRFLEVNETFLRTLGFRRDEVVGRTSADLALWADAAQRAPVLETIEREGNVRNLDVDVRTRTGEVRHGLFSGHPVTLQGEPCLLTVMNDITERKQAESEKAALERQLLQASKMEALGTLAGGVAHDFNNILAIIVGSLELALHRLPPEHPIRGSLQDVFRTAVRGREIVKQILTFSRSAEQTFRPESMHTLVRDALRMLRSSLPSTIEIRERIAAEDDLVWGDASQITQILLNLCTNAFHAMREKGGVLEVGLARGDGVPCGPEDPLAPPPGRSLLLTVRDSGHGMPPEVADRIFEPYFSTKGPGEGSGLGLAVVYGIVKKHGGAIRVDSSPGTGTEFRVFLPLYAGEAVPPPSPEESLPRGREEILLVDDEPALVDVGAGLLEYLGYRISSTTRPEEALAAFRGEPDRFRLVITDLTMPGMTGKELARELTRARPGLPVILTSGHVLELHDEKEIKGWGVRAVIQKPFVLSELAATVRRLLDARDPAAEDPT